jgi:hypothetical protein
MGSLNFLLLEPSLGWHGPKGYLLTAALMQFRSGRSSCLSKIDHSPEILGDRQTERFKRTGVILRSMKIKSSIGRRPHLDKDRIKGPFRDRCVSLP